MADLTIRITPCQLRGRPVCVECGCLASAALVGIGRYKVAGLVWISGVFLYSQRLGERFTRTARAVERVQGT